LKSSTKSSGLRSAGHWRGSRAREHDEAAAHHAAQERSLLISFMRRRGDRITTSASAKGRPPCSAKYEEPKLDEAVDEALRDFIARRERELPNSVN
jgi:hypothetical protein